jgi:hypothetical protein
VARATPVYEADMSKADPASTVNIAEEAGVGMASILYVPCTAADTGDVFAVLGFYSPLPRAFHGRLDHDKIPPWMDEFKRRSQLETIVHLLQGLDVAYRSGVADHASKVIDLVTRKVSEVENITLDLEASLKSSGMLTSSVEDLKKKIEKAKRDSHLPMLRLTRTLLERNASELPPIELTSLAVLCDYLWTINSGLQNNLLGSHLDFGCTRPKPELLASPEDHVRPGTSLSTIASILDAFVKNGAAHTRDTVRVRFEKQPQRGRIMATVSTAAKYSFDTLGRYWRVRQGHSVQGRPAAPEREGTGGIQLYLIRQLATHLGLDFLVEIPFSNETELDGPTEWICKLAIPVKVPPGEECQ